MGNKDQVQADGENLGDGEKRGSEGGVRGRAGLGGPGPMGQSHVFPRRTCAGSVVAKGDSSAPFFLLQLSWAGQDRSHRKIKGNYRNLPISDIFVSVPFCLGRGCLILCLDASLLLGRAVSHSHHVLLLAPVNAAFETMDLSFTTNKTGRYLCLSRLLGRID